MDGLTAEYYKTKGNNAYTSKDYASAAEFYSQAIQKDPSVASYYGNRAAAFIALNRFRSALEDAEQSVRLDPNFTKGYTRIGKCQMQFGRFEESEAAYKKALLLEKSNQAIKDELSMLQVFKDKTLSGESCNQNGNYTKAMEIFSSVLISLPDSVSAKRGAAQAQLGLKNYTRSLELIREVLKEDPQDEPALFIRAQGLFFTGMMEDSIRLLAGLLESDPDSQTIRGFLKKARSITKHKESADSLFGLKKYQESSDEYSNALNADTDTMAPFKSKLYCNRAACLTYLGKFEEAIEDCNLAIKIDENYVKAYIRRAKCLTQVGRHEDAVYDWQRAKELDPENKEVLKNLRDAQKDLKKAQRKDYYKLLEISRDANQDEITKAYRLQARKWHPDRHNDTPENYAAAEAKFKDINEANTILSDPKSRRRYDNGEDLEEDFQGFGSASGGHAGGFPPEMFHMFFGGGGGGSPFGGGGSPFGGSQFGGFQFHSAPSSSSSHGGRRSRASPF